MSHELVVLAMVVYYGGCSKPWIVRHAFAKSYTCPSSRTEVHPTEIDHTYQVIGCGFDLLYECAITTYTDTNGQSGEIDECSARERMEYQATDGTSFTAWFSDEIRSSCARSVEAALASAAHDLPCDRAALKIVGSDQHGFANVVDGCGQRITYQISEVGDQPATTRRGPVRRHKYILVNRLPLAAPPSTP